MKKRINDRRVLRGMENAGFIKPVGKKFQPKSGKYSYVDCAPNSPLKFEYKGRRFVIEYVDGCFFPFVFETV